MSKSLQRWILPLLALLVLGPLAGWMTVSLRSSNGGEGTSILVCSSWVRGLGACLGAFALAAVAGCLSGRMLTRSWGFFCAGLVLAWAAWGTGTIAEVLRTTNSSGTFLILSVEGLIVGGLGVVLAALIARASPREHPVAESWTDDDHSAVPTLALAVVLSLVAGGVGAWLIAQNSLKGQTVAAAVAAAILAAGFGRLSAQRAPALLFFVVMACLAVLGPAMAMVLNFSPGASGASRLQVFPASADVIAGVRAGLLLPLARPLPLDWIAGAFIGIPLGLNWAGSMLDRHAHAPAAG
ncbi:MAG: hypothetical protein KF745_01035 [Phycisphaeraceae bacterium]|nr:hypothetical protein [Phycisphaeraceae bacterium]